MAEYRDKGMTFQFATVMALVVGGISATIYVTELATSAKIRDAAIQSEIESLKQYMLHRTSERWRMSDQIRFAAEMARLNPNLAVPLVGERSPTAPNPGNAIDNLPNFMKGIGED